MIKAAGVIFIAQSTKRVLLSFRSSTVNKSHTFGFWGGKMNSNETIENGLTREILEEVGFIPKILNSLPIDIYSSPDGNFQYYSYVILVEEEFIPIINNESDGYLWVNIGHYPKLLHPGCRTILLNKTVQNILVKFSANQ